MLAQSFSISPLELWTMMATPRAPQIIDVRRRDIYESNLGLLPASRWREPTVLADWIGTLDRARPIVIACKAGKELSQNITAELRAAGHDASDARRRPGGVARRQTTDDRPQDGRPPHAPAPEHLDQRGGGRRSTGSPAPG